MKSISAILDTHGLRDTQSRRLVLKVLMQSKKPLSQKDIHACLAKEDRVVNLVTVYRILEKFRDVGLIHHSAGGVVFCSLEQADGHHVLLSCEECGVIEEYCDEELCKHEDRIAKRAGFFPTSHVSELIGRCASCHF